MPVCTNVLAKKVATGLTPTEREPSPVRSSNNAKEAAPKNKGSEKFWKCLPIRGRHTHSNSPGIQRLDGRRRQAYYRRNQPSKDDSCRNENRAPLVPCDRGRSLPNNPVCTIGQRNRLF